MAEEIGALAIKIGLDNTGFQSGIGAINKSMKVLDSEFKLNTSAIGLNGTALDKLKLKSENISKTMDLQKQKIEVLEKAYLKSVETKGKDATATQNLEIKLNQARTSLNNMGTSLTHVDSQIAESTTKTSKFASVQEKLHLTLGDLKTAFGVVGIAVGSYLKGAVDNAIGAQKSTDQLTNLLKNQGVSAQNAKKDIADFTDGITKMSDYSKGEAKDALTALTQKGISAGDALKNEGTIANVAAGTNTSLVSAANLVADAYHGKGKALVSLGILTKAEVKTMGDSSKAGITMAEVQNRLNKRFSGSAQTDLNSYGGSLKKMNNEMASIKTTIGITLLPILTKMAEGLAKIITPIADFISKNPKFVGAVLAIVAVIGTLVGGISVLQTLGAIFAPIAVAMGAVEVTAVSLMLPILAIIAGIALLVIAGYELYKNWDTIKAKASELWADIKKIFSNIGTSISSTWNNIKTSTSNTVSSMVTSVVGFFTGLKTGASNILNSIASFMSGLWKGITSTASNAWNGLKTTVVNLCTSIVSGAKNIWNNLINWFKQLPSTMMQIGSNMFTSMKNGITSTIGNITGAIKSGINNAISFLRNLPSQMVGYGKDMIQGMINGITSMIGGITNAVSNVASTIKSFLHFSTPDTGDLADYETWMPDFMGGLAKGIEANKSKVVSAIKGLTTDMSVGIKTTNVNANTLDGTKASVTNNYGSLLHTDKIEITNGTSIPALAEQLAFYMKQQNIAVGGSN